MTTRHRRIALLSGASITAIGLGQREPEKTLTIDNARHGERIEVVSSRAYGRTKIHSVRRDHA
jgi:hypothetical protein